MKFHPWLFELDLSRSSNVQLLRIRNDYKFSDFLRIKSEIHHYVIWSHGGTTKFQPGQDLEVYFHTFESDFDLPRTYVTKLYYEVAKLQIVPNMRWSRTYLSRASDASSICSKDQTNMLTARTCGARTIVTEWFLEVVNWQFVPNFRQSGFMLSRLSLNPKRIIPNRYNAIWTLLYQLLYYVVKWYAKVLRTVRFYSSCFRIICYLMIGDFCRMISDSIHFTGTYIAFICHQIVIWLIFKFSTSSSRCYLIQVKLHNGNLD